MTQKSGLRKEEKMKIPERVRTILAPLGRYRSPYPEAVRNRRIGALQSSDPKPPSSISIGGFWSTDPDTPTISHDDFVFLAVLPALSDACERFGVESVARDIVDLALPIYKLEKYDFSGDAASFLSDTLRGGPGQVGNVTPGVTNEKLAAKYGIKYVFGPIVRLGLAHQRLEVFSPSKYFYQQSCRMGEVIDGFTKEEFEEYIQMCIFLLEHRVYDWSIEQSPEEWGLLRPSIKTHGMREVLQPMANAMVALSHLPGANELKYHYSFLYRTITWLYPVMIPKVRKKGPGEINRYLNPIVQFVLELAEEGYFQREVFPDSSTPEIQFFANCGLSLEDVRQTGIQKALESRRNYWKETLPKGSRE
jgi:hypothetical protein